MRASGNMRTVRIVLITGLFAISSISAFTAADSAVTMDKLESLPGYDLGLNGAELGPSGEKVIAYGADSNVIVFSSSDPTDYIEMPSIGADSLNDASFHPSGNSAIIVGNNGTVLRYSDLDKSLTDASGGSFAGSNLTAVSWNPSGSWAYVGSTEGEIWRMRASDDGGSDIHLLEGLGGSDAVVSIECTSDAVLCVAITSFSGIAVIERDHSVSWVGGYSTAWNDLECIDSRSSCVAISSSIVGTIHLNSSNPEKSIVSGVEILGTDSVFTGISHHGGTRFLISMAPYAIVEHDMERNATFPWLDNSDVAKVSVQLSGERIISTWALDDDEGWILTDRGNLASFNLLESKIGSSIGTTIISLAVPLALVGLIVTIMMSFFDWGTNSSIGKSRKRSKPSEKRRRR